MSDRIAIRLSGVGKMYKLFHTRVDNLLDALGVVRLMPWRRANANQFWALRGIDLDVKAGSRVGIIGRNGAGKSTLLKLITGNITPTEGTVEVHGRVQALLEAGAGFHPEFTGFENIRAALTYQGMAAAAIEDAVAEIADFVELGQFLEQPFKTYSTGMQARLVFATATALKPDILIVDEILGAGDAYFASKSSERMKQLVEESGATVLLVSHALDQVARYCDQSIWMERGRVAMRGPSWKVINAYEAFIHDLEDRRLRAKSRKRLIGRYEGFALDHFADAFVLRFEFSGSACAGCDVTEISLLADGQPEETLNVGDVQDMNMAHASRVATAGNQWSDPQRDEDCWFRSLRAGTVGSTVRGEIVCYSYGLFPEIEYGFRVRYRCVGEGTLRLTIVRNGEVVQSQTSLATDKVGWHEEHIAVIVPDVAAHASARETSEPATPEAQPVRWPGEGSLRIEQGVLLDHQGRERAIFEAGTTLILKMLVRARQSGHFNIIAGATLARIDGVLVCNFVGGPIAVDLAQGDFHWIRLTLSRLLIGDGHYVFSLSLFEGAVHQAARYDLIARAYEFRVVGNRPMMAGALLQHPAEWSFENGSGGHGGQEQRDTVETFDGDA
jgi:ABC-type polysaccharide/polyol phosphate transport system ATPase subunit